MDNYFNYSNLI